MADPMANTFIEAKYSLVIVGEKLTKLILLKYR